MAKLSVQPSRNDWLLIAQSIRGDELPKTHNEYLVAKGYAATMRDGRTVVKLPYRDAYFARSAP